MKRPYLIIAVTLTLALLNSVSSQTPDANSLTPQSSSQAARPKGKVLVKRLPGGLEGVELKNGAVRTKPGYNFVKQDDGTVTVAGKKAGGGGGSGGTFKCSCRTKPGGNPGGCKPEVYNNTLVCEKTACKGSCKLTVVINSATTGVVMY
jgi:hypothetical protein